MFDGEALAWPWMKDARLRQPAVDYPLHPGPGGAVLLASASKRAMPEASYVGAEAAQSGAVGGHGVVVIPADEHLFQPPSLLGDRFMPASSEFLLEGAQFGPPPVTSRLP